MTPDDVAELALMLPEAVEAGHSANRDFRVHGRIFAILRHGEDRAAVKLSVTEQSVMVAEAPEAFCPVAGQWGAAGWTDVELATVTDDALRAALLEAWRTTAPPELVAEHLPG